MNALLLALTAFIVGSDEKPPCEGEPLVPVRVTASTAKAGFGPELLVDGRADTSWQPDADGAYNLWQWVRFDFGREVEITCIDVDNGVRAMPGEDESFCQRARVSYLEVHADRPVPAFTKDLYAKWLRFTHESTQSAPAGRDKPPITTTTLTLRIAAIRPGFTVESATGIAEVRFFGRPAAPRPTEAGPVNCGSRRLLELRDALLEHCASSATRPTAECELWVSPIEYCNQSNYKRMLKWLPIKEDAWNAGRLELAYKSEDPPFPQMKATFVRGDDGRWKVESLTCRRGKVPCELAHHVGSDSFDAPDPELLPKIGCEALDGRRFSADGKLIVPRVP